MGKTRKQLMADVPWRTQEDDEANKYQDAKLTVTNQPGSDETATITRHRKKRSDNDDADQSLPVLDPQLRYSFNRNFQFLQRVFTIDTIVKPLPPTMAYNVSRSLSFFTRIFTQFFDPEGIANAQKSLGMGEEKRKRRID